MDTIIATIAFPWVLKLGFIPVGFATSPRLPATCDICIRSALVASMVDLGGPFHDVHSGASCHWLTSFEQLMKAGQTLEHPGVILAAVNLIICMRASKGSEDLHAGFEGF